MEEEKEEVDYDEFENSDDETEFEKKKNIVTDTEESDTEERDESTDRTLELGDIIEILAPTHSEIHETTFYID